MSSGGAALARRGVRLLLQQQQQHAGATRPSYAGPQQQPLLVAAAARSLRSSSASAADDPKQKPQQQQQQQQQLSPQRIAAYDFARQTFGAVIDRYNPAAQQPLGLLSPFSPAGRGALRRRFGDLLNKGVVVSHLNRRVPGFSLAEMKASVAALYEQVNAALASGQRGLAAAEDAVASGELQRLRGDAHARALAGWERVEWRLAEPVDTRKIKIAHARYAQVAATSMTGFVQVTFKIPSKQVFAAYKRRGGGGRGGGIAGGGGNGEAGGDGDPWELAAGDPDRVLDVTDYWVLERKTAADDRLNREAAAGSGRGGGAGAASAGRAADPPGARWRLVARLSLHPPPEGAGDGGGGGGGGATGGGAGAGGGRAGGRRGGG
jgi:hypothetical protein